MFLYRKQIHNKKKHYKLKCTKNGGKTLFLKGKNVKTHQQQGLH